MPKVHDILSFLEEIAPPALAEEWDNVGALVDCGGEVKRVLCALDITGAVISEADDAGCQLIVSHHPVIFDPLRRVHHGEVVYRMIRKHISAICMHTNLDAAGGGVNDVLAAIFGLADVTLFAGLGRMGRLREPMGVAALAAQCAERFSAQVRYVDAGRPVETLAVMGGAGGGDIAEAVAAGADCLFTGEASHHDALDAAAAGLSLIVAGHFNTEFPVMPVVADKLIKRFPELGVLISRRDADPFRYVGPKG